MNRAIVIGSGATGLSAARFLQSRMPVQVLDTRAEAPGAAELAALGIDCLSKVERFEFAAEDWVIVSPGVPLEACLVRQAEQAGARLLSDIDLFAESATAPIYAVTGTNGKSTVTAMAGAMLASLGPAEVCGNIGTAALDSLSAATQAYALELSSFQIERMRHVDLAAAVVLNVSEDHLDRHKDLESYAQVKREIYVRAAWRVCNRADPLTQAQQQPASTTFGLDDPGVSGWGIRDQAGEPWIAQGDRMLFPLSELSLPGSHNALNFLAAAALVEEASVSDEALLKVAREFAGLPHRAVQVATVNGVRFVNDSKATNVGATLATVKGLAPSLDPQGRIVLIAGGDGKGAEFSPLLGLASALRAVVVIGVDGPAIAKVLEGSVHSAFAANMQDAVTQAYSLAAPGDCVLLAPACASLDMYPNYAARGDAFVAAVSELVP